jgi:hypothetical protein
MFGYSQAALLNPAAPAAPAAHVLLPRLLRLLRLLQPHHNWTWKASPSFRGGVVKDGWWFKPPGAGNWSSFSPEDEGVKVKQ